MDDFIESPQGSEVDSPGGSGEKVEINSSFSIPEEYADRGWARFFDGKTGDDLKAELFKSYDNQQSLIGKKVEDYLTTTDLKNLGNYEQIKESLKGQLTPEFNVPEDVKEYALDSVLKDENGKPMFPVGQEALDEFSGVFKELGISIEQGQKLFKTYLDYEIEDFKRYTDADELENSVNEMFKGNMQQRRTCENLIKEFLSPEDQQLIQDTMPNVIVEMFYKVSKGLVDKYGYKEGGKPAPSNIAKSQAERDAEYDRVMQQITELSTRPHKTEEKDRLMEILRNVYR